MKIQINSLAALERLIGGDTEVEIAIRGNIVQEFAKKHLKAVANSATINSNLLQYREELKRVLESAVAQNIGEFKTEWGQVKLVRLRSEIQEQLNSAVATANRALVQETVDKKLTEIDLDKRVNAAVNTQVEERIKLGVRAALDKLREKL